MSRLSRLFLNEGWDRTDPAQCGHHIYKRAAIVGAVGGLGGMVGAVIGAASGARLGLAYGAAALGIAAGLVIGGALWLRSEDRRTQNPE